MFLEFFSALFCAVEQLEQQTQCPGLLSLVFPGRFEEFATAEGRVSSTPLCFKIAKRLQQVAAVPQEGLPAVAAAKVAEQILQLLRQQPGFVECFHCEISGEAYLNLRYSAQGVERFLSALSQRGASSLFSSESLLGFSGGELLRRSLAQKTFLQRAESGILATEWESVSALARERLADLEQLESHWGDMGQWSEDQQVMLLALLVDAELDFRVYLRGLKGRENVPWYLRHYLRQVRAHAERVVKGCVIGEEVFAQWAELIVPDQTKPASWTVDGLLKASGGLLLEYRGELFCSPHLPQVLSLIRLTLEQARAFFHYYNHPPNRQLPTQGSDPALECAKGAALRLMAETAELALGSLFGRRQAH